MSEHITFYLVRHGEAENNVRRILDSVPGKKEYPLTKHGREQIAQVAKQLSLVGADALFSSPILRAKETAEIIAVATGLPIIFDDRLREAGMGRFDGQSHETLLEKYPNPEMRLVPDVDDGVESFLGVRSRLGSLLHELKGKYNGKKVILVSHGDPLEQLHGILVGEGPGRAAEGWYPAKGSCTEVEWEI